MGKQVYKRQEHSEKERQILKLVETVYSLFKYKMLSGTGREIYESCNTIRFYECLHEYFQYTEKVELEFVRKVKMRDNLLGELHAYYLKTEYLSIETWEGIEELLRCYVAAV